MKHTYYLLLLLFTLSSTAISQTPFDICPTEFYQVISGQLNVLNPLVTPANYEDIQTNDLGSYNATGFNTTDRLIYGLLGNEHLVVIGSDGIAIDLGVVQNLPILNSGSYFVGDFDLQGNYYVIQGNNLYKIDVTVPSATAVPITGNATGIADFAYYDADGDASNGFSFVGARGGGSFLVKIDVNAGGTAATATNTLILNGIGNPSINNETGGFGAAFSTEGGTELFFSNNSSGQFYRVNIDETLNPAQAYAVYITTAQMTNNNDGASCANAPSPFPCGINILLLETRCTNSSQYDIIATIATVNPTAASYTVDINNGEIIQVFNYADLPDPPNNQITISGVSIQGEAISVRIYDEIDDLACSGADTYDSPDCCQANAGILSTNCSLVCTDTDTNTSPLNSRIDLAVDLSSEAPPVGYEYVFFLVQDDLILDVIPATNYNNANPVDFSQTILIEGLAIGNYDILGYSYDPSDIDFAGLPMVGTAITALLVDLDEVDNSANSGNICADITQMNKVSFSVLNTQAVLVDAGNEQEVCSAQKIRILTLGASVPSPYTAVWASSGDGMFLAADGTTPNNNFSEAVFYMLGTNDRTTLSLQLQLSLDLCPLTDCPEVSDEVNIIIKKVGCGDFPWDGN